MRGLLLESHVPLAVVDGVKRVLPDCEIVQISRWRQGKLLDEGDEVVLTAANEEGLVLVSYDLKTIPARIHRWIAESRPTCGAALIPADNIAGNDVGGLVRALVDLWQNPSRIDPAYPIVYLQQIP